MVIAEILRWLCAECVSRSFNQDECFQARHHRQIHSTPKMPLNEIIMDTPAYGQCSTNECEAKIKMPNSLLMVTSSLNSDEIFPFFFTLYRKNIFRFFSNFVIDFPVTLITCNHFKIALTSISISR